MNQEPTLTTENQNNPSGQDFSREPQSNKVTVDFDNLVKVSGESKKPATEQAPGSAVKKPARGRNARRKKAAPRRSTPAVDEPVEETPQPFEIFDRELVKIFAGIIPFGIIVSLTKDKRYELTDHEKTYLAKYWDAVLMKYVPSILEEYGEEVTLVSAIAILLIQKSEILVVKDENRESPV